MRILYLSHAYPPTISGVSLVVQKVARALQRQGHILRVITASENQTAYEMDDQGVQVLRLRAFRNPFWSEGPIPFVSREHLTQLIDTFRPDVIHTHENAILSAQLLRLPRKPGVPLVSSCYFLPRYVTHYLRPGKLPEKAVRFFLWKYAIRNLNQFDHVIFSTHTQEQDYVGHGLRVPTTVISNGVDADRYKPHNGRVAEVEARYHLPEGRRVLFVGRLAKDKKIEVLIQAMQGIAEERDLHLLLVGRGDHRPHLEKLVRELSLQQHVHFLGFVPEEDLPDVYRASQLFAIASICEVQSIPALQAAATGLPLVGVNAAALPELVQSGRNGFLVDPNNPQAIRESFCKISADPNLAQDFGKASLEISLAHAETETFRLYGRFYREIVANTGRLAS